MSHPRFGIGFRTPYAGDFAHPRPDVDWLEVVSDHHIGVGGPRRALLERLRRDHPLALHGVGLGIAGSDPLDESYLAGLRELVESCEPLHVSDHLCWTALDGRASHDLLPLAHTEEVLRHVVERVERVQERLGRRLVLENATAYVAFHASEMDEAEFFAELTRRTGCGILLDVNNLFVNAENLGIDPARWLARIPERAVAYLHVAGHAVLPDVRIDTHGEAVPSSVWQLFATVAGRFPAADVILERDDALPPLAELVAELDEARARHAASPPSRGSETPGGGAPERAADREPRVARCAWPQLQRAFWECAVATSDATDEGSDALFASDRPVAAARGARVYRDGHAASLRAALATNFPALARVLARDDWERLTQAYLRAHPPRGHGFLALGARLAAFVRGFAFTSDYRVSAEVLAELAELEQAQLEVQDAPDAPAAVAPAELAAVPAQRWERLRPAFAPGLRVVRTGHDVAPVVSAVARGEAPSRPAPGGCAYLVARGPEGVITEALSPDDARLIEALLAGETFGAACAELCAPSGADDEEVVARAARRLVRLAAQGHLTAIAG